MKAKYKPKKNKFRREKKFKKVGKPRKIKKTEVLVFFLIKC